MKLFASHHLSSSLDLQDLPSDTVRALYHHHLFREADNNLSSITLVESLALHAEAVPHAYEYAGLGCPTIPTYTEAELQLHQRSDPVIGPVVKFLEAGEEANPSLGSESLEFKHLLKEWKWLELKNGLLYRAHQSDDDIF